MIRKRLIPILLIEGTGLVKTQKFAQAKYVGDPRNAVKIFNEKQVDELCILDIQATRLGIGPQFELIEEMVSEAFMPISYGGGITTLNEIGKLIRLGVEKVVLNSILFTNPSLVQKAAEVFGNQSIIVSVDIKFNTNFLRKGHFVYSQSGRKRMGFNVFDFIDRVVKLGAGELLINSIDRDGMRQGMDVDFIEKVVSKVSVPVVCCGGIGSENDIIEVFKKTKVAAIAAGSFFVFSGKHRAVLISYPNYDFFKNLMHV